MSLYLNLISGAPFFPTLLAFYFAEVENLIQLFSVNPFRTDVLSSIS